LVGFVDRHRKITNGHRTPFLREWVNRAWEIHQARAVATADREEADPEFDALISPFRLDPAALTRSQPSSRANSSGHR